MYDCTVLSFRIFSQAISIVDLKNLKSCIFRDDFICFPCLAMKLFNAMKNSFAVRPAMFSKWMAFTTTHVNRHISILSPFLGYGISHITDQRNSILCIKIELNLFFEQGDIVGILNGPLWYFREILHHLNLYHHLKSSVIRYLHFSWNNVWLTPKWNDYLWKSSINNWTNLSLLGRRIGVIVSSDKLAFLSLLTITSVSSLRFN